MCEIKIFVEGNLYIQWPEGSSPPPPPNNGGNPPSGGGSLPELPPPTITNGSEKISDSSYRVTWVNNAIYKHVVLRISINGGNVFEEWLDGNSTSFTFNNLSPGQHVYYQIYTVNEFPQGNIQESGETYSYIEPVEFTV